MKDLQAKIKTSLGPNLAIATYSIVLFLVLVNIKSVLGEISGVMSAISPFIMAFGIAFVLNLPLKIIENKFLNQFKIKDSTKRSLSIFITFTLMITLFVSVIQFVFPQLKDSVSTLTISIPTYAENIEVFMQNIVNRFDLSNDIWVEFADFIDKAIKTVTNLIALGVPYIINTTLNIATGTINFLLAIVMSIYMLSSKERIILGVKKVIYALLNKKTADKITKVVRLSNKTFSSFIGGQLTEAFILGGLTTAGLFILRIEYAVLIGVIVGITSIIPIFGAFIGAIPSIVLLLMVEPFQALVFIVYILVLQQFEGNIIYPKVVGNSIGISGLWIMFAILLGGSLGGILGIILGIPGFAVVYILTKEWAEETLKNKKIDFE